MKFHISVLRTCHIYHSLSQIFLLNSLYFYNHFSPVMTLEELYCFHLRRNKQQLGAINNIMLCEIQSKCNSLDTSSLRELTFFFFTECRSKPSFRVSVCGIHLYILKVCMLQTSCRVICPHEVLHVYTFQCSYDYIYI